MLKIGDFLTIKLDVQKQSNEKYRCKIIDKTDDYIYVDYPVHIKTSKTLTSLRSGMRLIGEYLVKDESVYQFKTEVIKRIDGNLPAIVLSQPRKDEINRIQRRQHVRVNTALDIAVQSVENNFLPFTTVTVNISGGGMAIILPDGVPLGERERINLTIVLPMESGEYHYLELIGEVIRVIQDENALHTASIKFISPNDQDKQLVIRFCFEKQREERQKELE